MAHVYMCVLVCVGIIRERWSRIKLDTTFYFSNNLSCHLPDINHVNSIVPILEG